MLPNIYLKTAQGKYLDLFAYGRDIARYPATKLQGIISLQRQTVSAPQTLPAGIVIKTPPINGTVYQIITTEKALFKEKEQSTNVTVEAIKSGTHSNLAPGYYSILDEPIEGISITTNADWITVHGTDEEYDDALRQRVRNKFTAVGRWHHDAAYRDIIAKFAKVPVDYIFFEHDAPRGPGSANAYIMTSTGAPSQAFVDEVNRQLETSGEYGHGDDLVCFPIPTKPFSLKPVVYLNEFMDETVKAVLLIEIENRIRCAFRQNSDYAKEITQTMPFVPFSFSRLAEELHARLPDLRSIEFRADDIVGGLFLVWLEGLGLVAGK